MVPGNPNHFSDTMAKPITFEFDGDSIQFEMHKVDRSRLYGYKELEVLDEEGNRCELTTLADDGRTLIGKGGTGIGYLTADGNWVDKSQLSAVNAEGKPMKPVGSSFAAPVPLKKQCSIEAYLDHNIRLTYLLKPLTVSEKLHAELVGGAIFQFDYSYRGGLVPDTGFVMMNDDKQIFFLVGDSTSVDYKSLQQAAAVAAAEEETGDEAEDDLMDFGMI